MRRFVQVNEYGINKWPTDYVTEFAPLIAGSRYCKGSLMPMTLDKASNVAQCTPFPPVYEEVFSTEDKLLLTTTLNSLDFFPTEATFEVLSLYEKCKAVHVGKFVLGSAKSRHKSASIVQVYSVRNSNFVIAKVEYYLKFHCKVTMDQSVETKSFWFAAMSLFADHNCKNWFGNPTEVWSRLTTQNLFIPLSHIKCRTAYVDDSVNFGKVIGNQNVLVVVPLINEMHHVSILD